MSLGWNTESALLPSKAKPIVGLDSRSMLDLKAVVSEKEEERIKKKRVVEENEQQLRRLRGAAGTSGYLGAVGAGRDVFSRTNKGVEDRQAADIQARNAERARKRNGIGVLEKKAELYERLKRGDVNPEAAEKAGFLVDFERKDSQDHVCPTEFLSKATRSEDQEEYEDLHSSTSAESAEVEDEFGRSVVVAKGSEAHNHFLARRKELKAQQDAEIRRQQQDEDQAAAARSERGHDFPQNERLTGEGQQYWPVSSGAQRSDCGDWSGDTSAGSGGKGLEDFYDDVGARGSAYVVGGVSGGVKSRWEQTLSVRDKGFLQEVIAEEQKKTPPFADGNFESSQGEVRRSEAKVQRRDPKAERRELLRKKAEAREAKKARSS